MHLRLPQPFPSLTTVLFMSPHLLVLVTSLLYYFLDSPCKWYHTVSVFLWFISLSIMPFEFYHVVAKGKISCLYFLYFVLEPLLSDLQLTDCPDSPMPSSPYNLPDVARPVLPSRPVSCSACALLSSPHLPAWVPRGSCVCSHTCLCHW